MRLLSFLTDIERAIEAEDSSPSGGVWENTRTINYHEGIARLALAVRADGRLESRGSVLVQGFLLADGTTCVKANLSWKNGGIPTTHAVYDKPGLDWSAQARAIATAWLNGVVETSSSELTGALAAVV